MKHMKKLLVVAFALAMCMAMSATVFAAGTGKVTVEDTHKGQIYKLYKIFDATTVAGRTATQEDGISYKLMSGKTNLKATVNGAEVDGAQWFTVDGQGNVTIKDDEAKAALTKDNADFKAWAEAYGAPVAPATGKEASADNAAVEFDALDDGYYFLTTTTGSLFSIDSIAPDVTIKDKNPGTNITKKITDANSIDAAGKNALAQVGTTVKYESRINIKEGAYNYKFTDTMTAGLTLDPDSVKVYLVEKDAAVATGASDVNSACGTITAANQTDNTKADITIAFGDAWLKTNKGKDIVIQYSATVNKDAIVADAANPNTAKIEYGNEDKPLTDEDTAKVYSAKVTVKKVDGDGNALEGAGFKLKNADNKWYKITEGIVSWVDSRDDGTQILPAKNGGTDAVASFTGLADGTYTLVETKVPEGYNKAADTPVTIKPASTNNLTTELTVESEVTNNSGTELPTTGGMGTTLFYVLGGLLVVGCAILLVARRRTNNNK